MPLKQRKLGQVLVDVKITMAASRRKKNMDHKIINHFSDVIDELYDILDLTPVESLEKIKI